jgi:hypothetical protein
MSRWRIAVVAGLLTLPLVILMGLGGYYLWSSGWGFYAWWPMGLSFTLGYLLAWYWHRKQQLLQRIDFTPGPTWTARDRQAWQIVEARAKAAGEIQLEQLGKVQFYVDTAQSLAMDLARFYHPEATDPIGQRTIPEILAVIELATHDLAEMVHRNLPGGHLMTIDDWRWAGKAAVKATDWYQKFSNTYWLLSALVAPLETGLRYAATQAGMARPWGLLRQDLVAWFYTAFVQRMGHYLIELNSGRLRVGVRRYRELQEQFGATDGAVAPPAPTPSTPEATEAVQAVSLTIIGQVKMGKSSFVNALLGEQRAQTDVLPATSDVTRYELQPQGVPVRLTVFDTVGYAHTGPREDQLKATTEAVRQSDLIVLVLHARNPARQADLEMLQRLKEWFATRPDLKMPPVVAVLTHIDLLSPAMEWSPPYNWIEPQRPKEQQIQQAVAAVREQLGEYLAGAVPVCTAPGKVHGIQEWFLPVLTELLGEARGVAFLRCLKAEAEAGKTRRLMDQFVSVGKLALRFLAERPRR